MKNQLFRKLSLSELLNQKGTSQFNKTMNSFDLIALGVGAVVGTGIFILPGTVAAVHAGPAIVFSFILAAIVCAFSALCYSELSSSIPVAGSAYTYSYVIFGELIAWIIGWSLLLEYGLAVAAVATGWSAYFQSLVEGFGIHVPQALSGPFSPANGTYINLPAIIIILLLASFLSLGMKESNRLNKIMVFIKLGIILLFILVGMFYVKPDNWQPFMPFGFGGILSGAALVIFAYLGFDAVSSAAEEVKNPQRNMPIGIIGTLVICTILYVAVSLVLTGMVPYTELNVGNPVAYAMEMKNLDWVFGVISLGAVISMMTVIFVMLYGGTRLVYSFARDGMLPKVLSEIHPRRKIPLKNTWIYAIFVSLFAGFIPIDKLAELVNIGTLIAFAAVSIGVIFIRKMKIDGLKEGFKVPLFPIVPILSCLLCIFMIVQLSTFTMFTCLIWMIIGLLVYFVYGRTHSVLNKK
ncbi:MULTISPECIES: amino acid permease [Ureibacillus]|jgi:basic amino acid/polyamine antiporter, APA family|uniref:APA family basic amino acid/polyamine antiporter n=1 Tax=Ureibacillus thermosphaericus TaxID=51173 RepID=A0A840PHN6_URETH|nr:amino acid permease [Ureibacillus thermosphaericus]MBB5147935.1 APA family basic amino acid/polyamine antiporter [Ureibacillus thermosphaericus]NKZ30650.1 amino acid permease [Ureibacillus thermosphaericus]